MIKEKISFKQKTDLFLHIFMYELEHSLNEKSKILTNLKYQEDEANTDKELKSFLKNFIFENSVNSPISYKKRSLKIKTDKKETNYDNKLFSDVFISGVYTADELTKEQKEYIKNNRNGVYTNPDLLLEIGDHSGVCYCPLEIKSTKKNKIPGSSIQQVEPDDWVIFIKRSKDNAKVSIGKYIDLLIPHLNFPDRSPRPQISFDALDKHNEKSRFLEEETLTFHINEEENKFKKELLTDWQQNLSQDWFNIVVSKEKKKRESWFTRPLRLFALKYIQYYESLSKEEKEQHKKNLETNFEATINNVGK